MQQYITQLPLYSIKITGFAQLPGHGTYPLGVKTTGIDVGKIIQVGMYIQSKTMQTILVVDDEPNYLIVLSELLRDEDYAPFLEAKEVRYRLSGESTLGDDGELTIRGLRLEQKGVDSKDPGYQEKEREIDRPQVAAVDVHDFGLDVHVAPR